MAFYDLKLKLEAHRDNIQPMADEIIDALAYIPRYNTLVQKTFVEQLRDSHPDWVADILNEVGLTAGDFQQIADKARQSEL